MTVKTFIKAALASAALMWVVAGVAHELVFVRFFNAAAEASHKGPAIILLAYCILGVLMTYFYSFYPKGRWFVSDGLKFGALIGVLWVFPHGLAMAAAHDESILHEIINGTWHLVEQGIGGVLIAFIFQRALQAHAVPAH